MTYQDPAQDLKKKIFRKNEISHKLPSTPKKFGQDSSNYSSNSRPSAHTDASKVESISTERDSSNPESSSDVRYEDEVDKLLDDLGPRYEDWPGDGPLPVDADLLPGVFPGYRPPFRLLPYGVRSTLSNKEATALRRLARVLPPHFALGMCDSIIQRDFIIGSNTVALVIGIVQEEAGSTRD